VIMGMHLGIGFFLGLWPFSLAMIAVDLVFIRDASWERAFAWVRRAARAARTSMARSRSLRAVGGRASGSQA